MDRSLMCSPSASAARAPNSMTRRFKTGSAPGNARHTGHVFAFGSSPKRVEHPQKIFDSVLSWAWTSSPMMVSQLLVSGFMFQVSGSVDSINLKPETRNLKHFYGSSHFCGTRASRASSSNCCQRDWSAARVANKSSRCCVRLVRSSVLICVLASLG